MIVKFRIRRDTAGNWTTVNPTLALGEPGLETDTNYVKYGDGVASWTALPYAGAPWTAIGQKPAIIVALSTLTPAADTFAYFTGANSAALNGITTFSRSLLTKIDGGQWRGALGIGTAANYDVGTSGNTVPLNNTNNIFSGSLTTFGTTSGTPQIHMIGGSGSAGPYFRFIKNTVTISYFGAASGITGVVTDDTAFYSNYGLLFAAESGVTLQSTDGVIKCAGAPRADADNTRSLGTFAVRWTQLYAASGTINTSDRDAKRDIGPIPDEWLDAWGDVEWCRYHFVDGERWHIGLVAQQVHEAFAKRGIDAFEIGLLCRDKWPAVRALKEKRNSKGEIIREARDAIPAGERWGLRYDECQAMEAAYLRRAVLCGRVK